MIEIIVYVRGGVVQDVSGVPKGIVVKVYDYDVDGISVDELDRDENGTGCIIGHWKED